VSLFPVASLTSHTSKKIRCSPPVIFHHDSLLVALTALDAAEVIRRPYLRAGDKIATTLDLRYEIMDAPHGNHAHALPGPNRS
jgi:hypothetical protein